MNINILIPCAGSGKRFQEEGFEEIKPFILTKGKLMIEWVVSNFITSNINPKFHFIFQNQHIKELDVNHILKGMLKQYGISNLDYTLIGVDGLTDGSASTILQARNSIDLDESLVIANSDQYISRFDVDRWLGWARKDDASILTFKSTDSKWSFVKPKDEIYACEVVEKEPVSDIANIGMFYYQAAKDCMWAIKEMKEKKIRIGNEYYLAPSINELIGDGAKVSYKMIEPFQKMWGLGTPFDHKYFEENFK